MKKSSGEDSNKMDVEESDIFVNKKENILEKFCEKLINFGANEIDSEKINTWICYPLKEIMNQFFMVNKTEENKIYSSEVFLFNKANDKRANIMCRNKYTTENQIVNLNIYSIVNINKMIYEVDSNFLIICEKMQIFNFRQMYIISVRK